MPVPDTNTVLVTGGSGFIGTNLVAGLKSAGVGVVNFDKSAPLNDGHRDSWVTGDVCDPHTLAKVLSEHSPSQIVHLAARVDIKGRNVQDYATNTIGTSNLLEAASRADVDRLIVVSTQFVSQPGHIPESPLDYNPHTAYGESKVAAEEATRRSHLPWVIVRPTTVWGAFDLSYRRTFYETLDRGLYFHPRNITCHRSMGYVGNVVHQILGILNANADEVIGKTFYLGDPVINLIEFVDAFSLQITGARARTAPVSVIKTLAGAGTILKAVGIPAPITLSRYRSMTEDYVVPLDDTYAVTGRPPSRLDDAVAATVIWLRANGVISPR